MDGNLLPRDLLSFYDVRVQDLLDDVLAHDQNLL
jgi:hypothetical protein